jgi:hypothetical protein
MKISSCDDVNACMDMAKAVTESATMAWTRARTLKSYTSSIDAKNDILRAELASNYAIFMTEQALRVIAYVNHIVDEQ